MSFLFSSFRLFSFSSNKDRSLVADCGRSLGAAEQELRWDWLREEGGCYWWSWMVGLWGG